MKKDNNDFFDDEFFENCPELKGLPVVSDYRLILKDDKKLREILYDLAVHALLTDKDFLKYENTDNIVFCKKYAKNVITVIRKSGNEYDVKKINIKKDN